MSLSLSLDATATLPNLKVKTFKLFRCERKVLFRFLHNLMRFKCVAVHTTELIFEHTVERGKIETNDWRKLHILTNFSKQCRKSTANTVILLIPAAITLNSAKEKKKKRRNCSQYNYKVYMPFHTPFTLAKFSNFPCEKKKRKVFDAKIFVMYAKSSINVCVWERGRESHRTKVNGKVIFYTSHLQWHAFSAFYGE